MKKNVHILCFLVLFVGILSAQDSNARGTEFTEHIISTNANGARSVSAADVNGDGNMDVLSASADDNKIAWYENNGNEGFTEHIISTDATGAISVYAVDVNGDGDMDVLSASYQDDTIAWYENNGSEVFTEHIIPTSGRQHYSVYAIDVNGDGDMDVLSASALGNMIAWYENNGSEVFTEHIISTDAIGARSVSAADVNGDGNMDVLSASADDNKIAWYENNGSEVFTERIISTNLNGPNVVYAEDINGDGDMDVLSASYQDDTIAWYENNGSEVFTERIISTNQNGPRSVYAADVNGDGDMDVLAVSSVDNKIAWYENNGSEVFTERIIHQHSTGVTTFISVYAVDINGNGDMDVLSASYNENTIAWYENIFFGCTNPEACNYNSDATADDGSCLYNDCLGNCGGPAELDDCGVCNGNNADDLGCGCFEPAPSGCDNTCGSTLENDECGICGGDGIVDGACDCNGNVLDCAGICGGSTVVDGCGQCQGNLCSEIYGDDLIDCLVSGWQQSTIGYNTARDTLFLQVDRQEDGFVRGIYTDFAVELPDGVDPSTELYHGGINAEHIWPQSLFEGTEPMKSDMHNLRPSKDNVNAARGNKPYGEIIDSEATIWYWLDTYTSGIPTENIDEYSEMNSTFFEPREDKKGDIARTIFYFYTMYKDVADDSFFEGQKEILKQWHLDDPPSIEEIDRTWKIAAYQGSPNPFVLDWSLIERVYFSEELLPDLGCGCGEPAPWCDGSCAENGPEEDDCGVCGGDNSSCIDECGIPNGDGSDCSMCNEGGQWFETVPENVTILSGENVLCNEDVNALEDLRVNNGLGVDHPLLVGNQTWRDGKLTILVASYNPNGSGGVDTQLTEIPSSFGDLTNLTSVYLEMNNLTHLPDEFTNLSSLTSLTISNNYLTELPEDFGNLSNLFFLDLGYNQLESLPYSICELQGLYYFYIFNNNLTGLPDCMCDIPVNWSGFDGGGYPFYGSGANELCYDIPDCIEESNNFELSLDQFYYSTILDEPQDCPWTYLESFPVDDTIELYWDNFEGEETRGGRNTDTYTLSLENLNLWGRAGTVEIWMDNPGAVAGFQITLDGMGITNLSGGSAEANGFTVANASSGGGEIVLGFSFTGAVIDPSNGPEHLTTITFDSEEGAGICFADAVLSDANGNPLEVAYDTECVYWQNCDDSSACNYGEGGECEYDSCAEGPFQIFYSSEVDIGGFQISLPGANITSGYGGAAANAGFTISTSSNLVLGFSFTGNTIDVSDFGLLVELDVGTPHEEICIDSATLSDAYGNGLDLWIESCNTIHVLMETAGCMDESACNYNPEATEDDGSCDYPDPFYDCDGNCTNDPDGDGVCNDSIFTYNVYRDGSLHTELLVDPEFIDDVGYYSSHCYTVTYTNNIYNQESEHSNEACTTTGGPDSIYGCMDENACNYNPDATIDDGTCDEDCGPPECLYDCPNIEEYFAELQDPSTAEICGYFGSIPLGFNNPCIDDCEEDVSQELAELELCCPSIEGGACDCDIEEFDGGFTVTPEYEDCNGECGGYAEDDLCGICDGDNAYNRNAISTGMYHGLALLEDGSVMAWGDNSYGQLGDGTVDDSFTPVAVIGLNDIVYVAAGAHHSFAIESDGTLWAWGYNDSGQLGIGHTIDQHTPVEVQTIGEAVIAVAGGYNHSIALTDVGNVFTWGSSGDGALGNGVNIPNSTNILDPIKIDCPGTGFADAIAAGQNRSYIIDSDANGWAFGDNSNGRLGDGTTTNTSSPVSISTIHDIEMIAAGVGWGRHTVALLHDGTVWAWGDNERGQLGVDTTLAQTFEPIEVTSINNVIDISAGSRHSMALKSDGRVWVWGANDQGQLGDDTFNDSSAPIEVAPMSNLIDASAGGNLSNAYHTMDGAGYQIAQWGEYGGNWPGYIGGFSGQIGIMEGPDLDCNGECFGSAEEDECGECDGDGSSCDDSTWDGDACSMPENTLHVTSDGSMAFIYYNSMSNIAGFQFMLEGADWMTGTGSDPENFNVSWSEQSDGNFIFIGFSLVGATIPAGCGTLISLEASGESMILSDIIISNLLGQDLGFEYFDGEEDNGIELTIPFDNQNNISSGEEHSVAINREGNVIIWGSFSEGQPAYLPPGLGLEDIIAVESGDNHVLALTASGNVIAWGDNAFGETDVPEDLANVVQIAAGGNHSVALTENGNVHAWGYNSYGQTDVPDDLTNVIQIASGSDHVLAIVPLGPDGLENQVISWGKNAFGESSFPDGLEYVIGIAAGSNHSVALTEDGNVHAWGANCETDVCQVEIPEGTWDVSTIDAMGGHTLALTDSGNVVAWGWNIYGQSDVPEGLSNIVAIEAGKRHSLTVTQNGEVVPWGDNENNSGVDGGGQIDVPDGLEVLVYCDNDGNVYDECGECDGDGSSCELDTHFTLDIEETGESTLFISNTMSGGGSNMDIGDELAIFDKNGIIDSLGNIGEILVGTWKYEGLEDGMEYATMEIETIGSKDLSDFGGPILPGYVSGNTITIKIWDVSEQSEYDTYYYINEGTGTFDGLYTDILEVWPCSGDTDADGICDDVDDCVGAYDECGECNGPGIPDGACDCNEDLVLDDCGVCGGINFGDYDEDGECDANDPDDDNDGALDDNDSDDFNEFVCSDVDGDTCDDCSSGNFDTSNDGDDFDGDGACDDGDSNPGGFAVITYENITSESIDIIYNCNVDIVGFQFTITGVTLTGASTTLNSISYNSESGIVLGFDPDGGILPSGSGTLASLTFEASANGGIINMSNVILGSNDGIEISLLLPDDAFIPGCNEVDCTGVCGGSAENCPDWQDDPGAYEHVATLVSGIVLDQGTQLGDAGDILAALDADGNVRGVAIQLQPPFGPYAGSTLYEMTMRSNNAGDILYFKYYDASEDAILDIASNYTFVINDILGDVFNPHVLNINYAIDFTINLIAGFNWISFNVVPDDPSIGAVLASVSETATFINSQSSGTSTNYGADYGWYGGLAELNPKEMYLLTMSEPATLTITGMPVDVGATPIDLIAGWNWIGYLPQNAGSLEEALLTVNETAIFINSQASGTATNYGEYGWYGSLATLEPGAGYLLKMDEAGTLTYPEFNALTRTTLDNKKPVELTSTISDWDFNYADYLYTGTITASIENRTDSEDDIIAVFVDGKCRGIAERMYFPFDDSYMYIIQVYSNIEAGEELSFKYYDTTNDEIIEYYETIEFTNYMHVGNGFDTFALAGEIQPGIYTFTDAYPNPFNPATEFTYIIGEAGMVNISVYDINGRLVTELTNGYATPGSYMLTWDAGNMSSGMYFIKMIANNHTAMQKVMLIK